MRNYVEKQGMEVIEKLLERARKISLEVLKGGKRDRPLNRLDNKDVVRETSERTRKFREGKLVELRN